MGERKYHLDWLRVAAFLLLILFHVGMLYVTWGYNLKSPRIYPDLEYAMNLVSPWRLALLFFIAGVASRFLLAKHGAGGFAKDRVRRLLPVILLGMFVINPPQVYVEVLWKGVFEGSYLDFWFGPYMRNGYAPYRMTPTWDHLWFLLYLLAYALPLAAIFAFRKRAEPKEIGLDWLIVLPGAWLALTNVLVMEVKPVNHSFFDDWANHLRWIGIYAAGVTCAVQPHFWEALRRYRRAFLLAGLVSLTVYFANLIADFGAWDATIYGVLSGFYGWIVVLVLAGYAAEYWNRNSRALAYLTDAVLPIYVFHQPIMLVFAYYLFPLELPVAIEALLLILVTGAGSVLAYEIFARRTRLLRFLFGLKPVRGGSEPAPA
jgi:glucan biosynthesis protein C